MEEIKTEPVDFVKEFQEYLTQQTQHVNMISGSVCGDKEPGEPFQAVAPRTEQNGLDPPSVDVSLPMEDGPDVQVDGLERTCDGKYKCSYCSYANKGMARLIEHIRIHTGEKPHRCQLCPFASAYERHLEAHVRSHTGEKPYKCDVCAFRCSDRSNLSHHRRRRHKLLPTRAVRSSFSNKRMLSSLQKRTASLGFSRRMLVNYNPPSMGTSKSDYLNDMSPKIHHHMHSSDQNNHPKVDENDSRKRDANCFTFINPLDQLSTLAGQLADLHPESQAPASPDRESLKDEKPILIQHVSSEHAAICSNGMQTSPPKNESPTSGHGSCSPAPGLGFEDSLNTVTASLSNSLPSTPAPALPAADQQLLNKCQHCDIHFLDNILYTIHMGCHGYEHPFQCNICGHMCVDKYNFSCHFARGQHIK
ncbi:zinc finger protein Pegasus-like [Cyclopterus lumpus]|uniref:Zinc finger protein Pegasus n=1 Tax=Cyclopterus lumpus TaxID=8103 RepID=A0A8C2WZG4_CYCLU|nr:zinc finger protein Pegasus-like [Cyclopterus lumpus]XP_034415285.1 zinc finger protein Pegasus-like [Cyclopterus lumpus]XP_034415286.1 zinc finger protein Pegasus-like [Cyclopterus lumpus]